MKSFKFKITSPKILTVFLLLFLLLYTMYNIYYLVDLFSPKGLSLSSKMVQYKSQTAHLALLVPSKWYDFDLPHGNHGDSDSKMVIESPFFSSVYAQVFAHEFNNIKIEDVIDWGKMKAQSNSGFQEISLQPYINHLYSGYTYEYTRPIYAKPVKFVWKADTYHCLDWYTIISDQGYDFSFCSVDRVWKDTKEIFMKIIDSIEFDK